MGAFLHHEPCDACGSSDGRAIYADGSGYCFVCSAWSPPTDGSGTERRVDTKTGGKASSDFAPLRGTIQDIPKRGIREATCARYGYAVGELGGEVCHIAPYRPLGVLTAQHIRQPGKDFSWRGDGKSPGFFGQHLFNGGKSVVITEGELDCLAVAQAFDLKWPVVSLPNGAQSAAKAIQAGYEWLDGFEKVYLWFDNDEPGRAAVEACAPLLPPGKAHVITAPEGCKDANDVLLRHGSAQVTKAYWNAAVWRPDGIVSGAEITKEQLKKAAAPGYPLPWPALNDKSGGIRKRELTLLTAGSGIGKSTIAREIAYHLATKHKLTIGNVFLEESQTKTAQGYVAIDNSVPLGKLRLDPEALTDAQWDASMGIIRSMFFHQHFGSLESERLLAKMRYMAVVLKVDFIILDHISIVISGQESSPEGERRDIDRLMTKLRQLVEETGVGVLGIVHLNKPEGRAHEEGGRVTLSNLRGSGALKQLSDNVWAAERDQQDKEKGDQMLIRVLKNRELGDVGEADTLSYSRDTGRLSVVSAELFPAGEGPNI